MASIPWRPRTHRLFGKKFNRDAAAFLLGARRLEAVGAAPMMDPAVLEEMLEHVGAFESVELVARYTKRLPSVNNDRHFVVQFDTTDYAKAAITVQPIGESPILLTLNMYPRSQATSIVFGMCYAEREVFGTDGLPHYELRVKPVYQRLIIEMRKGAKLEAYDADTGSKLKTYERRNQRFTRPLLCTEAHFYINPQYGSAVQVHLKEEALY